MSPDGNCEAQGSFLARRLRSKDARFRSAVVLGFVVVTVGALSGAPGAGALLADESLWPFASLVGRLAQPAERTHDVVAARPDGYPSHRSFRHSARLVRNHAPVPLARESICVRTCDGFAFPVGAYHGDEDRASHEAACRASCPDAKTALYVSPSGSSRIDDAVNVITGRTYSALPDAFHYTTVLDDACTCHRPGRGSHTLSVLRDMTLRRGDAVMTARGFRVFHGAARFPYRRSDFLALSQSRDVARSKRPTFSALERESLKAPAVAGTSVRPPIPAAALNRTAPDKNGA